MKKILLMLAFLVLGSNLYARSYNQSVSDHETGGVTIIDVSHSRVHNGDMYQVSFNTSTLSDGTSASFLIDMTSNTITKELHLALNISTGGQSIIEITENSTYTSSGTASTAYNMNRDSTKTCQAGLGFYGTPTSVISRGTTIHKALTSGGTSNQSRAGANIRGTTEWILKPGKAYSGIITNASGGNIATSFNLEFYETL